MPDTPVSKDAHGPRHLRPLAVSMLAWLLCAGILESRANLASPAMGTVLAETLGVSWHLLIPLLAGWLFQVANSASPAGVRLRDSAVLAASWAIAGAAVLFGLPQWGLAAPWADSSVLTQQAGLLVGLAAGWPFSAASAARIESALSHARPLITALAALATVLVILAPVRGDTLLSQFVAGWSGNSRGAYGKAVLTQFYGLLKAAILWVPIGMLLGFAHKREAGAAWVAMALLAFLLMSTAPSFAGLTVADLLEIGGAYGGMRAGLWLGSTVLKGLPASTTAPAPAAATVRPTPSGPATFAHVGAGAIGRRLTAACLVIAAAGWAWSFPRWGPVMLAGLVLLVLALGKYRHAWLFVVPAALPLLSLAPQTGRFFFDEFDLLMLLTAAMAVWHGRVPAPGMRLPRPLLVAAAVFVASTLASLLIGLLPLPPVDMNAFSNYWSNYNALQVGKGLLWALVVAAMLRWSVSLDGPRVWSTFTNGMLVGLAGVIVAGLWERWQFADLFDLSLRYRITATFVSMHTGGSEIETYLAMAMPFAWLVVQRGQRLALRLAGFALLALGAYLATLTIARGAIAATAVVVVCLAVSSWRAQPGRSRGALLVPAAALGVMAAVLAIGLGGGYLQSRFSSIAEDWGTRVAHWKSALALRDDDLTTQLFGMGLGRFPATYLHRAPGTQPPGNYRFASENGNTFLSLAGSDVIYMAQRVPVSEDRRYTLSLRARSSTESARLGVPLCEKHLLDSRACAWNVLSLKADGQWQTLAVAIDSGKVGAGNLLTRRPVELALYNDTGGGRIDVDDIDLRDAEGRSLIGNGDFAAGADRWFFKTHSHLPWHIKNLWVSLLFEQGWAGLIAFSVLIVVALVPLARRAWQGDRYAGALLAATGGFLTIGIVGSPFDTPRIALLFCWLIILTAMAAGRQKDVDSLYTRARSPGAAVPDVH